MKKVLSVVLAVAMVLGCVASLAFVLDNQTTITTPTNSALKVENFYVTDDAAMKNGVMVYSDLTELHGAPYDKNSVIRFAVELAVYNPTNPTNGVVPTATTGGANKHYGIGNLSTLIFESDTVDFHLAESALVLYKPYVLDNNLSYITNVVQAVVGTPGDGVRVSEDGHSMELDVYYYTSTLDLPASVTSVTTAYASQTAGFYDESKYSLAPGLYLFGASDKAQTVKTDYTLVLTGVTVGELDQEGLVTLQRQDTAGDTFSDNNGDGEVIIEKNGHTYWIKKIYDNSSPTNKYVTAGSKLKDGYTTADLTWNNINSVDPDDYNITGNLYDVDAVGYRVSILLDANGEKTVDGLKSDGTWGLIGRFETEQVRYGSAWGEELEGKDVEGLGHSMGLAYWDATNGWKPVYRNYLEAFQPYYINDSSSTTGQKEVYALSGDAVEQLYEDGNGYSRTPAGYMTERQALDAFLSDFGFGTGTEYSYKVIDANFTNEGTFEQLGTADYNGNAIVIPQPEEDPDVEEPTDNDEVPDEGDIDEELPDEGDIDEEPIPDEPVPETGDASAAVAVALTAAALVAAAGLAVVLKKAR